MGSDFVPPVYTDYEGPQIDEETESQLKAAFYNLNLSCDASSTPVVDTCLAHLKLLRAFEELKSRTGLADGLWDIWDSRAQDLMNKNISHQLLITNFHKWDVPKL